MSRGTMPRPTGGGGGRQQPSRRVGKQPTPKAAGRKPTKATPARPTEAAARRQLLEQQRRAAEEQRRAAWQQEEQRLRRQQYAHEVYTGRREEEIARLTSALRDREAQLDSILARGLQRSAWIDLDALQQTAAAPPAGWGEADAAVYRSRIARVAAGLRDRDPRVVESFLRTVLRRVPLPAGVQRRAEVSHDPHTERAVLRVELPGRSVVPGHSGYEYIESADETRPVPRPAKDAAERYRRVLAQVTLLVVRDVFEAERGLAAVTFHGYLGPDRRCLVHLSTERASFVRLELAALAPMEALAMLDAAVSADPYAYQPVTLPGPD